MQVKENTNVVQSNFLLENRPKFTMDETRLFLTIIASVNKDDEDFTLLEIPVSEFAGLWNVDSNAAYRKIKEALRGLRAKEFSIEGINKKTGKMRFLTASSVAAATYEEGEGYATVEISQMFRPYLLAIKDNYTNYVLKNILQLSTVNAIRNYELMKQYEGLGKRSFSIKEYKRILCIEDKYSRNTDLRVYVIEPACKEINENTDIKVKYEIEGRGQNAKVIFTIRSNKKKKASALPDQKTPGKAEKNPNTVAPKHQPERNRAPEDPTDEPSAFEMDLMDTIPKEVHKGRIERVRAILSLASQYIAPANFMEFYEAGKSDTNTERLEKISKATREASEDWNERILDAVNGYTVRDYNIRRDNIQNPNAHYKYFLSGFEGWLLSHQY